jgi:predicted nucleic acid-binding Zn ribbon protein
MRVSQKEVEKLFNFDEAVDVSLWFVARRYRLFQGLIYPDGPGLTNSQPLSHRNLFLSFARLAAHGQPSEKRILSWVHQHGLLRRQDYDNFKHIQDKYGERQVNQKTLTVEDFRKETRKAYGALTLFQDIRSKNYQALRSRLRSKELHKRDRHGNDWITYQAYLDNEQITNEEGWHLNGEYSDSLALKVATTGLEHIVERQISDVHLHFVMDVWHPRPLSNLLDLTYRPRLSPRCPDLHSALWYQFAVLISDKHPWENCIICGMPFPQTRKDRVVCGDACQKRKERDPRMNFSDG